jgi:hypothetical protein
VLARRRENVYTDPGPLDVAAALRGLPELSLDGAVELPLTMRGQAAERPVMRAQKV